MRLLMVMAVSVRENLRKRSMGAEAIQNNLRQVAQYLTPDEFHEYRQVVKNRPLLVMSWIGKFVHQAYIDKHIKDQTGQILMSFDSNVSALLTGWMGMNKVCYQPVPFPYVHTLHWFIMIWLLTLPLVLVQTSGYWVIMILPLVSAALMAIEEVSEEIEDPFGDDLNDLPTENFEIGLIRDAGMVLNEHTGPMEFRCKAELGLEQVGQFVPIVDYTPAGGSAKDVLGDDLGVLGPAVPTMGGSDQVSLQLQENPVLDKPDQGASAPRGHKEGSRRQQRREVPQDNDDDGGVALAIEMMSPRSKKRYDRKDREQRNKGSPPTTPSNGLKTVDFGNNR
eukprot:TRINITY_DN3009_c0_g1_i1.p1 TRINITY_DN3009_c0_g1~~TRINITY_DN3009_c0_g1_i1.p1  ORF type:complete len:336 (-),score=100.17 TRINITY_DN3009_c0_g1_i1:134-1141(-)